MAFPERLLSDGEQVEAELHPHWRRAVGPILWLLALTVAGGLAIGLLPRGTYQDEAGLAILVVLLLAGLILVVRPLLRWRATTYVVTDRRLIARSGLLNRTRRDLPLARLSDLALEQRGLDRVMGSGDVVVYAASEGPPLRLAGVPGVHDLHRRLHELAEAQHWQRWQPPAQQPWERYS